MDKCFELLNSQSQYIKFTCEKPKANWLPFLNVQVNLSKKLLKHEMVSQIKQQKHPGSLPICSSLAHKMHTQRNMFRTAAKVHGKKHKALKMANFAET
ncbi:hypothetical protein KIN20_007589 [Parelaphostrongylus tenuis]|uniref:Uncharacterized protein n=1 Tax=Parelaphostrongylus tenuis TaxID=148309 RepID=A0AAD5QHZ0_PARTN|nr:hypothetical protein KIN20_007589 [Parelaphostrongylus tenuis]